MRTISLCLFACSIACLPAAEPVGTTGLVGCLANPKKVSRLEITKPGVYENYLVDGNGASGNLVKITAGPVTLRHCEIRNGSGNGIGIFAPEVTIENCRIHHMLAGTFKEQHDAHGIAGHWGKVVIRNCDISLMSGDCIQFDPDRASQGSVLIEHCHLWTGPLPADAAGFKAGERPGENAVDTKIPSDGPRCELSIRHCHLHGFNQPAQIENVAALNLKENVDAVVEHCVFNDNEVSLRVRGPGKRGGAHVSIKDSAIYDSQTGVRAEDKIEQLKIRGLAFGRGVTTKYQFANGKPGEGYENVNEHEAPPLETVLKK
ncbi:MAG: right-handed parallel beta-helix repeat-containing protein [Roseimicrobium sp.]